MTDECHVQVYKTHRPLPHYPWVTRAEYGEQSTFWVFVSHTEALAKALDLAELRDDG